MNEFNEKDQKEIDDYKKSIQENTDIKLAKLRKEKEKLQYKDEYGKYDGEDRVVNSYTLFDYYKKIGENPNIHKSGITSLDKLITGFEQGEMCVISGITGNGKTLFAKTLTYHLSLNDINCLWFTYEEQPKTFLRRFHEDFMPVFFLPNKHLNTTLSWIEERIIESKVKYSCKVVFIDHLHFLIPLQESRNTSLLIGGIMRELKKIALKHEIVLFILAHTHKIKQEETPDLSNLRDSSFIAQEADKVIIIRRKGKKTKGEIEFTNESTVYILKNRMTGVLGKYQMFYDFNTGFLKEE